MVMKMRIGTYLNVPEAQVGKCFDFIILLKGCLEELLCLSKNAFLLLLHGTVIFYTLVIREIEQFATSLESKIVNLSCRCLYNNGRRKCLPLETIDMSGNAYTVEYLQEVTAKAIIKCEQKLKCLLSRLVTDNAANVSKMKGNLKENTKPITWFQYSFDVSPSQSLQMFQK